ncbi:uncharacterized protein EV420DRAFT_1641266 [Desarmillaria tabescens]|uniref:Uncharacterized protein n=1 Tax=Armillaria tabescens TaxID=1929756 RepID=A0AA39N812_ARMTA|nr:uncharacterized protein EV420DRAFT_1641266 [Desarmillaria tabescens]KAK0460732.1 hypothetical protein EV420DRAFT_1641266 [Desarmillaria tabescens]
MVGNASGSPCTVAKPCARLSIAIGVAGKDRIGGSTLSPIPERCDDEDACCARLTRTKSIRPLPPTPKPAPQIRRLPPRPLPPCPPVPSITVIPPTPSSPSSIFAPETHNETSETPLLLTSASPIHRPPALVVLTSPDALKPSNRDSQCITPLTPSIPQAPTPTTARRKRLSKLRRHLGETIPDELILGNKLLPPMSKQSELDIEIVSVSHSELCFARSMKSPGSMDSNSVSTSEESEELDTLEDDEDEGIGIVSAEDLDEHEWFQGTVFKAVQPRRYSQRWYLEKGGKRWEDTDYTDILSRLRSL